jgi:hypothetical protein
VLWLTAGAASFVVLLGKAKAAGALIQTGE